MNDALDQFERLVARAKCETPQPAASVAPEVLRRLRNPGPTPDRPLWWVASGACACAAVSIALNYSVLFGSPDVASDLAVYAGWMMF